MYPDPSPSPANVPPAGFDTVRFGHLLDIVGDNAAALIEYAISDLQGARDGISSAGGRPEALRSHSHVLCGLAGTLGGTRLQLLAEDLNQSVHAGRPVDLDEILRDLDALIRFLIGERGTR